jgi:hypothetical protein
MTRLLLTLLSFALAALSVVNYARDQAARRPGEGFARTYTLDVRRARYVDSARLEPKADLSALVLANAALEDALGTIPWREMSPAERERWVAALSRLNEELAGARALALEAVAARPGWPFHRLLLGQLVYAADRRALSLDLYARPERWMTPLREAASAAPGVDLGWTFLGGAMLESWGFLPQAAQREGAQVLRRAFLDPSFVSRAFCAASDVFGRAKAMELLPDATGSIRAAREALAGIGDVASVATLEERWERLEMAAREADLKKLEERARLGDENGLRAGCHAWVATHPLLDFDTPKGRKQAARVLELWPGDVARPWRAAGRGELVRFFLDGRAADAPADAVGRAVGALVGVPEVARARAALMAGDRYALSRVLHDTQTLGTFEWTPLFVELSRMELRAGRLAEAVEAVGQVAPGAREECEVLLVRRDVARAEQNKKELDAVAAGLRKARAGMLEPQGVGGASLSLCVDSEQDSGRVLAATVRVTGQSLVAYGWNRGRLGAELVEREKDISVPLAGRHGRVAFSIRTLAGGAAEIKSAVVK